MIIVDELSLQIETVVAETRLLFNERALNRKNASLKHRFCIKFTRFSS